MVSLGVSWPLQIPEGLNERRYREELSKYLALKAHDHPDRRLEPDIPGHMWIARNTSDSSRSVGALELLAWGRALPRRSQGQLSSAVEILRQHPSSCHAHERHMYWGHR